MKKIHFKTAISLSAIICQLLFCVSLTACSSDDEQEQEINNGGRKVRQLTINEVPITRASFIDNTSSLGAKWTEGDKVTCFNLTEYSLDNIVFSTLEASSSASISTLTGSITCDESDELALIYPEVTIDDGTTIGNNRGTFTIDLSGQNGTLEDLAKRYHYVYGVATIGNVNGSAATGTITSMNSLLAICKFKFKDAEDNPITVKTVKTLEIGYSDGNGGSVGYPQTCTLHPKTDPTQVIVPNDLPLSKDNLLINLNQAVSDGVYVALFPVGSKENKNPFYFSVKTGDENPQTYTGTFSAYLIAGKYYSKELKLTLSN